MTRFIRLITWQIHYWNVVSLLALHKFSSTQTHNWIPWRATLSWIKCHWVFFFSVGAFRSKDVSTYPVGILWRTRETSWPSVGTIDTQLTGCSHVSWDLDPRVRDGTWGALNTGACDEGLSQDAHLRALIMCPLVEPLRGKRGCAFFQLLLDFLVLSSTFLAEWDSLSFSFF